MLTDKTITGNMPEEDRQDHHWEHARGGQTSTYIWQIRDKMFQVDGEGCVDSAMFSL
jgi:hypothetical protein